MTHVTSHQPGSFCWIELVTSDAAAARAFYTGVFDWSVREIPMGDQGSYFIFEKEGRSAAACYGERNRPPHWLSYVAVADVDATGEQVKALGGRVLAGPMDVFTAGRTAMFSDPQGAGFAVWQPGTNPGVGVRDEPDALCWNELQARDLEAARAFYPPLFQWRVNESPDYTQWHLGEHAVGGMLLSPAPPQVPSSWLPYFAVADCEVSVEKAQGLGGQVIVPPMDIEHVGRFAVLKDPQGALFALIRLAM